VRKQSIVFAIALSFGPLGTAHAQQCLHGTGEAPEQAARRREALTAARTVNNIQYNRPGPRNPFLSHAELATAPFAQGIYQSTNEALKHISLSPDTDILPGWKLTLDVTSNGYWFMVKDTTDPCGFAIISNQSGLIFNAEPLR